MQWRTKDLPGALNFNVKILEHFLRDSHMKPSYCDKKKYVVDIMLNVNLTITIFYEKNLRFYNNIPLVFLDTEEVVQMKAQNKTIIQWLYTKILH